jgi:hypothetical protein
LTPCCAQTGLDKKDSICLTSYEFNYFIGAAYDSHTYKQVIDSLRKMNAKIEKINERDSIIVAEGQKVFDAKNEVIKTQNEIIVKKESELKVEGDKKKKWRLAALVAIPFAVYGNVKKIIL